MPPMIILRSSIIVNKNLKVRKSSNVLRHKCGKILSEEIKILKCGIMMDARDLIIFFF